MPGEPGLGLGHAQGPLPRKGKAGDTSTAGHLDSDWDDQAYTFPEE